MLIVRIRNNWRNLLYIGIFLLFYLIYQRIDKLMQIKQINKNFNDKFYHNIPSNVALAKMLNCKSFPLKMRRLKHGSYWLIENLFIGSISRNIGCADSITLATNSDYTFFWALGTLVKRWLAPISFAIYAPGYDFTDTMVSIQYVRNCLPESRLIQKFVTFHIYFLDAHMPESIPFNESEALKWPYDCRMPLPFKKNNNTNNTNLYRKKKKLTYPINVGRNIARKAANTYFIFTSDIELFPSPGLVDKFLQMIMRNISLVIDDGTRRKKRVFVVNVYELINNATLPNNKIELKAMIKKKIAKRFHAGKCLHCHQLPYEKNWLNITSPSDMSIIGIAKRQLRRKVWEPFYISDNKEPVFDERVHWEGQSNKRIQGFAMCLLDYDYYILNDGFLVHSPGIKLFDYHDPRNKFISPMNYRISWYIMPEYRILYGENQLCGV